MINKNINMITKAKKYKPSVVHVIVKQIMETQN